MESYRIRESFTNTSQRILTKVVKNMGILAVLSSRFAHQYGMSKRSIEKDRRMSDVNMKLGPKISQKCLGYARQLSGSWGPKENTPTAIGWFCRNRKIWGWSDPIPHGIPVTQAFPIVDHGQENSSKRQKCVSFAETQCMVHWPTFSICLYIYIIYICMVNIFYCNIHQNHHP